MYKERCLKAKSELTATQEKSLKAESELCAAQERIQQLEGKLREAEKKEDEEDQGNEELSEVLNSEEENCSETDQDGEISQLFSFCSYINLPVSFYECVNKLPHFDI